MRVAIFLNGLGLGGTEKAACRWARGLRERGHAVAALTLQDGPRRAELAEAGIEARIVSATATDLREALRELSPEVIHAHAPGFPHEGDVLGEALAAAPRIPVVQTNIFGRLQNPREDAWTDQRLFISWTSCVQAARRAFRPLDEVFFSYASVAVYPLDPLEPPPEEDVAHFRAEHGVQPEETLFGRLSRPEPNKWTDLPLDAFRRALRSNPRLKLLLREPPPAVANAIRSSADADRFVILPATSDAAELRRTLASLDVVLHTSSIGESFGYGIAEPMNLGKPVITNSLPWLDQAQLELVRHGEGGLVASTRESMSAAMLTFASDASFRREAGQRAQQQIRALADPVESLDRLESSLHAAVAGTENPRRDEDLRRARAAAAWLDQQQFGHTWREQLALRPHYYRVRFHEWRQAMRKRVARRREEKLEFASRACILLTPSAPYLRLSFFPMLNGTRRSPRPSLIFLEL